MKQRKEKNLRKKIQISTAATLCLCLTAITPVLSVAAYSTSEPAVGQSLTKSTGLNIRKQAGTDSAVLAKLDPGAYIEVIGESGDFYQVRYTASGAIGYCHKDYIKIASEYYGTVQTKSGKLNLRSSSSTSSKVLSELEKGTVLPVLNATDNGWIRVVSGKTSGYVYSDYLNLDGTEIDEAEITIPTNESVRSSMTALATSYLGTLYEWGGDVVANPNSYGFDCSHFTYEVMKAYGLIDTYRTAANQYRWCTKISRSELKPGDLIFYKSKSTGAINHVVMYLGDNMVIGANGGSSSTNTPSRAKNSNAMVKIQSIDYSSRERLYGRAPGL